MPRPPVPPPSAAARRRARRLVEALAGLALALLPAAAPAQPQDVSLGDLALLWASGEYLSPVLCELPGGVRRIARQLRIEPPAQRGAYRRLHRLEIDPLPLEDTESPGAACKNDLGGEEPELRARATLAYPGHHRPDTARRDFEQALRHDGGFRYQITAGELRIGRGDEERRVDLGGGTLEVSRLAPHTDAYRMLGDVGDLSRRRLVLEARDGTRVELNAVHVVPHHR